MFSNRMQRVFVLSLRYIAMPVDRPERMLQGGASSGQQASRYGHIEGLLFDVNNAQAVYLLLHHNFNIDYLLANHSAHFKLMDIPLAIEKCRESFLASVSNATGKVHSFAQLKRDLQQYGPNNKTLLELYAATQECTFLWCLCPSDNHFSLFSTVPFCSFFGSFFCFFFSCCRRAARICSLGRPKRACHPLVRGSNVQHFYEFVDCRIHYVSKDQLPRTPRVPGGSCQRVHCDGRTVFEHVEPTSEEELPTIDKLHDPRRSAAVEVVRVASAIKVLYH